VRSEMTTSPDKRLAAVLSWVRNIVRTVRRLKLTVATRGRLSWGRNAYIGGGANVYVPRSASIGSNVSIGRDFLSQVDFRIGDECLLSSRVSFVGHDHDVLGSGSAYFSGRLPPSTVVLEGNNFVGYGATLVGSVQIGYGAVIGAGALVLRNVPRWSVVGGVPAREIGRRSSIGGHVGSEPSV
jgi:chloramphenicol O-acetyltransferase type B